MGGTVQDVGAGSTAATIDPTLGTGSSGQTAQGFEPGMDDPANVVSDPFFDPVVGSANIGSDQPGTPGRGPYTEPTPTPTPDTGQPKPEAPPTSAAGGPHTQPQGGGVLGSLAPTLKTLAGVLGGGQKGPSGGAASGTGTSPIAKAVGNLGSFLSGQPQKPQPQRPQPPEQQPQTPQAPQGTEGGGVPGSSPPTAQAAPSPPQFGQQAPLAAFPTTLAHLAQAAPTPADASPTPPTAAQPGPEAGPGAASGQAAPGAAPDPQMQAITGSPEQSLRNLLEGRTQLPAGAPAMPAAPPGVIAPTAQMVSQSRVAGTSTAPTAGFSPYLAQQRSPYAKELDDPRTALRMAAMMSFEHENDPVAVAESLMNRTAYSKSTLGGMLSPRFYGPMRKPRMFARRMAELQRQPERLNRLINAARTAAHGTNLLGGATDQGSGRDPNVRYAGGRVIRHGETYNDWGGGPGGHAGAQRFREEQQRNVHGGQRMSMNEPTPQQPQGDIGTGAGALPQPEYMNTIQRLHDQRKRDQGIKPERRGEGEYRVASAGPSRRTTPTPQDIIDQGFEGIRGQPSRDLSNQPPRMPEGFGTPPAAAPELDPSRGWQPTVRPNMASNELLDWLIRQAVMT